MKKITLEHFGPDANPRFIAFIKATGRQVGGTYEPYEFITWINARSLHFKRKHKTGGMDSLSKIPNGQARFTSYLESLSLDEPEI